MDPIKLEKMQFRRLCNRGHQGLWHPYTEEMMGIQDVLCLTATVFVKENVAKAHPQGRKGKISQQKLQRSKKVAFPASSQSLYILKTNKQTKTQTEKQTKTQTNKNENNKKTIQI